MRMPRHAVLTRLISRSNRRTSVGQYIYILVSTAHLPIHTEASRNPKLSKPGCNARRFESRSHGKSLADSKRIRRQPANNVHTLSPTGARSLHWVFAVPVREGGGCRLTYHTDQNEMGTHDFVSAIRSGVLSAKESLRVSI
jgi:hypothetical protein